MNQPTLEPFVKDDKALRDSSVHSVELLTNAELRSQATGKMFRRSDVIKDKLTF